MSLQSFPGNTTINLGQNTNGFYYYTHDPGILAIITILPFTINQLDSPSPQNYLTVNIVTPMTLTNANDYFICGANYMFFDGQNNLITVNNISGYMGFIQNGVYSSQGHGVNAKSNVTVQNIILTVNNTASTLYYYNHVYLAYTSGWICQGYFGNGTFGCNVINCSSDGPIGLSSNNGGGGILGDYSFSDANDCFSSGEIMGYGAGGIFGQFANSYNSSLRTSSCTATNCYSTGNIDNGGGAYAGGIFGANANNNNHAGTFSCVAINCYSMGNIDNASDGNDGGIFGGYANSYNQHNDGSGTFSCIAINCYSMGNIDNADGGNDGGIFGGYANSYNQYNTGSGTFSCIATNCYSTGNIDNANGGSDGGIFGGHANSYNSYNAEGTYSCTETNCYSTGNIDNCGAGYNGGIFGANANSNNDSNTDGIYTCVATNCYSTGNIDNAGVGYDGGIFGTYTNINTNNIDGTYNCVASNCYSAGNIDNYTNGNAGGGNNGGIFGSEAYNCTAIHCYVSGTITISPHNGNGGIFSGNTNDNPTNSRNGSYNYSEQYGEGGNPGTWNSAHAIYTTEWLYGLTSVNTTPSPSLIPIWLNLNMVSDDNIPFLLYGITPYYYNANFYSNITSANIVVGSNTNLTLSLPPLTGTPYFNIISPNSSLVNLLESGQMTSNMVGTHTFYIIGGFQNTSNPLSIYGYNTIQFTLNVNSGNINNLLTMTNTIQFIFNANNGNINNLFTNTSMSFSMYSSSRRAKTTKLIKSRLDKLFK